MHRPLAAPGRKLHRLLALPIPEINLGECNDMQVNYGESLKLVGSGSELGDWNVEAAPEMQWTDGDVWVADVELPADQDVHFKVGRYAVSSPRMASRHPTAVCLHLRNGE